MFSSLTTNGAAATLEALARGATDFFAKPAGPGGLDASRRVIREELVPAIRALCTNAGSARNRSAQQVGVGAPVRDIAGAGRVDVLAIGASTGGPNALAEIFFGLRVDLPVPVLVVQHMPPMFTQMLAERLTRTSPIPTMEAKSGMVLEPGRAYVAPGDYHLTVARESGKVVTKVEQSPPENACRPAFDPLLRSVAMVYGRNSLAVVLTGMGQDGLRGCEAVRATSGQIIAQDEATSVVWGMPGYVVRAGLADRVMPVSLIAGEVNRRVRLGRD
jgi:two-component system chemotaxis response regulator CheB